MSCVKKKKTKVITSKFACSVNDTFMMSTEIYDNTGDITEILDEIKCVMIKDLPKPKGDQSTAVAITKGKQLRLVLNTGIPDPILFAYCFILNSVSQDGDIIFKSDTTTDRHLKCAFFEGDDFEFTINIYEKYWIFIYDTIKNKKVK